MWDWTHRISITKLNTVKNFIFIEPLHDTLLCSHLYNASDMRVSFKFCTSVYVAYIHKSNYWQALYIWTSVHWFWINCQACVYGATGAKGLQVHLARFIMHAAKGSVNVKFSRRLQLHTSGTLSHPDIVIDICCLIYILADYYPLAMNDGSKWTGK
jgi:hypothetical protein